MKKLLVGLLVSVILLAALPAAPVAAVPDKTDLKGSFATDLNAILTIDYIGEGSVRPVGDYPDGKYKWMVKDRPTGGSITSNVFNGSYELVYSGILNPDQSGSVHGDMTIKTAIGNAIGNIRADVGATVPTGFVLRADGPHTVLTATLSDARFLLNSGTGAYKKAKGTGTFEGAAYLILDSTNQHVIGLANGSEMVIGFDGQPIGLLISQITLKGKLLGV